MNSSQNTIPYHVDKDFVVKKMGGINAAELDMSSENVRHDPIGKQQAVVVSAMRSEEFNTTNHLIGLGSAIQGGASIGEINERFDDIKNFHLDLVESKLEKNERDVTRNIILDGFGTLQNEISHHISKNNTITPSQNNDFRIQTQNNGTTSIMGFGEVISSKVMASTLQKKGYNAQHLDISNLYVPPHQLGRKITSITKKILPQKIYEHFHPTNQNLFKLLSQSITEQVDTFTHNNTVPIISGYIGSFPQGIEQAIGRGYSDATGAMISVGYKQKHCSQKTVLEIQKSVSGLLSADPRLLYEGTIPQLIPHTNYITAKEITGFRGANAKLLHEQALRQEVIENEIIVHLQNPFDKQEGTVIDQQGNGKKGILTIGARDDITLVSISSVNMFREGFISDLSNIVKDYFSIDIVDTSQTEITFSIERGIAGKTEIEKEQQSILFEKKYAEMEKRIKELFHLNNSDTEFIERTDDIALLFCTGQHIDKPHLAKARGIMALENFSNVRIQIDAQGRLKRGFILGVPAKDKERTLNTLHTEYITHGNY